MSYSMFSRELTFENLFHLFETALSAPRRPCVSRQYPACVEQQIRVVDTAL